MTLSLHHINQMILQLPALGSHVAGQAQAGEVAAQQERILQAQEFHRDTVEIVSGMRETDATEPLRAEPDERRRARYEPTFGKRAKKVDDPYLYPSGQIIDRRV
jgi:hypothetical protein